MKIAVLSCDKNDEVFEAFHHCMEKYWPNHPEVIYFTETITNPYYKTIAIERPIEKWTKGLRQFLNQIDDNQILIMMDDCFIRKPVDVDRIQYASNCLSGNIACFNFELSFDRTDEESGLIGFKKRRHGSDYEVSLMCGLWDKEKLLNVISKDTSPWQVEFDQNNCGYDYYINSGNYIIDWGYRTWNPCNIFKGKWCRDIIPFFEAENIEVDYTKKGFR
jgi:hypothetical protein